MERDPASESRAVVTGLGLVCVALFAGVSLYTHSPYDVLDYHAAQSSEIQNKAGLVGAQLAHHAFCVYGAGAWVIAVLMLLFGGWMSATRSMSGFMMKAFGAALLTALACTWAAATERPGALSEDFPAGSGGLLGGAYLAPPLISYFGRVGVFLVLTAASVLCCLLVAPGLTEVLLAFIGRGVVRSGELAFDMILGRAPVARTSLPASPFASPEPALAGAGSASVSARLAERDKPALEDADVTADMGRVEVIAAPETRRLRIPLSEFERAARRAEEEDLSEEKARFTPENRIAAKDDPRVERKLSKAEEQAASEAEEAERRRQEAVRQAEAAEAARLERERQAKEDQARQAKALEKLEKERAAQDEKRAKQQEKFNAAMAEAAAQSSQTATETGKPEKPKPQLPVNYNLPKYDILIEHDVTPEITSDTLKERGVTVIQTLWDFNIGAKLMETHKGPTVTMYELELDPGVKVQRVVGLQDNLAIAMKAANGVRVVYPIPGKNTIGIEIPNVEDHTVRMRPILESPQFRGKSWTLPLILGRGAVGNPLIADLATMPHLLIAGTTGSGKSVCVNSIILSIMILRRPHEVKLILVDPKQVEMTDFKGIPHLLSPVVTDMKLAAGVLTWAVQKMEDRYERMSRLGVRNIATFNRMTSEERLAKLPQDVEPDDYIDPLPYIVIVVDEFADLMLSAGKEIEQAVQRLAQKARAAGIHVILATQRPSADVITGIIKANFPCRICFQVKSKVDSRIVLEANGADKLAGKGDMLFIGTGNSAMVRAKGVYIADDEIRNVVGFCKGQAEPVYSDEIERVAALAAQSAEGEGGEENNRQAIEMDEKFDEAVEILIACGRASTSLLQRRMGLGYTRAAKLCDQMEARGIVGPDRGAKGRELLITQEQWDEFKRIRTASGGTEPCAPACSDGAALAPASSDAAVAVAEAPQPDGESVNPSMLAQLENIDGVKDPEDEGE